MEEEEEEEEERTCLLGQLLHSSSIDRVFVGHGDARELLDNLRVIAISK